MKFVKFLSQRRIVNFFVTVLLGVAFGLGRSTLFVKRMLRRFNSFSSDTTKWKTGHFLTATAVIFTVVVTGLTPVQAATVTNNWCAANVDNTSGVSVYDDGTYCYVAFKTASTTYVWTPPATASSIDLLVVAGGGGGGARHAAGGGAGGLIQQTGFTLSPGNTVSITVGAGGAGGVASASNTANGNNGSSSVVSGSGITTQTAIGGGGGGSGTAAGNGGSGGGGNCCGLAAGTGTAGQGNAGSLGTYSGSYWLGGAGGGAGASGTAANGSTTTAGIGGTGQAISWISTTVQSSLGVGQSVSSSVFFAGGGGGGTAALGTGGSGGSGGGGRGGTYNTVLAVAGTANTGGGGGGGGMNADNSTRNGADGGSGVVVVRYARSAPEVVVPALTNAVLNLDATQSISYPGTGNTWTDLSGSANNATISGTPTFATNRFNFDGNSSRFITVSFGTPDFSRGITVSVVADFGTVANNFERLVDFGSGSQNNNFMFERQGTTNNLAFEIYNGVGGSSSLTCIANGAISSGLKEYRAVVDGSSCKLYVDGVLQSTTASSVVPATVSRTSNFIGKSNWAADAPFEGSIQKVAIYNYPIVSPNLGVCEQQILGSTLISSITASGNECTIQFTGGSGSWVAPRGVTSPKVLVVGGGGGGGSHVGGGGGGGGVFENLTYSVTPGTANTVTVGAGGRGSITTVSQCNATTATAGSSSVFASTTVAGGGNGASWTWQWPGTGANGGGGSGSTQFAGGIGTSFTGGSGHSNATTSGNYGYPAGGGAGAGGNGGSVSTFYAGNGGVGVLSAITGTYFGGGGGGGFHSANAFAGTGGLGGGGNGNGYMNVTPAKAPSGTANTGGGGGGSGAPCTAVYSEGGNGGSGIVVVRYTAQKVTNFTSAAKSGSTTEINLAWSAPASSGTPSGYRVERSASGANYWTVATTSTAAASSTATSTTVTGLASGTTYDFRVIPYYSGATSQGLVSDTVSATTNVQATASIGNVTATTSGATFTITSTGVATVIPTASVGGVSKTVSGPVGGVYTVTGANPGDVVDISVSFTAATGYVAPAPVTASSRALATVTLGSLSQTYDGTAKPVTVTTSPTGRAVSLTYTGTAGTTFASSSTAPTAPGSYTVNATLNDGTYTGSATGTLVIAKADQSTVTITNSSTVVYGSTLSLTASGGSSSASGYTFTRVSGPCTISGTTLSTSGAGDCIYNAFKAGDANYNQSATSSNFTTTITPKPLTLSVTVSPTSRPYDTSRTVSLGATSLANISGLINSDQPTIDNSKLSATVATADVGTNKAVTVTVASGYLSGPGASNYQLPTITGSPTLTITQASQAAITFTSALTTVFGQNITISATGGSGTGALTFATSSGACQIASSILTPVSAGTCVVVATRAADTNYTPQTASYSVSIAYADQAVVSMTSATTVQYGSTLTLGAQGGSGTGAYEFAKVSGNCSISGTTLTPSAVGDCVVKARRAGDSGYNVSAWSADVTISITPKPLTIVVTPFPSSREYNGSRTVTLATLSSAHVTGLVGNDSITLDNSKISATVPDASVGVNKSVTTVISSGFLGGTHAANYQEPTVSNSPVLTITQATQSAVTMSSATTFVYGSSLTLTATGGTGTGALEYAVVSGNCSVTGDSLTASSVGDCVVKARRAADTNYSISEWSASQTVTVTPKPLTLAVTVNPSSRAFDTTRTVTLADTTAADLTGIINNDVVTVDNSKLSATVASAIVGENKAVTVTVASGYLTGANAGNYQLPTISGSPTVNIVKADQSSVTMTSATTVVYGNTLTLSASGGESVMGYEYEVVSGPCSVSAATLSTTAAGTCEVRGRHLGDTNYNVSAWSANVNISVTPKPLTLSVTVDPSSRPYNTSTAVGLAATSSSNLTGIINNDVVTTDDTKLSAAVTTADVGTNKAVTVTVNTGFLTGTHAANYSVSSVTGSPVLTITQISQAALSWTAVLTTIFGQSITLSATGGSGTGALSFATTSGPCTVSSSIVTPSSVGTCVVVVTRAADTNYTAQTLSGNLEISQASQATVAMTNATTVVYGSTLTLTATGGSGNGAFDFAKVNGNCVVENGVLTPLGVGDCVVHARKLSSTNYTTSAWSNDLTVTMTAKPLTLSVTAQNRQWNGGTSVSLASTSVADLNGVEAGDSITVDDSYLSASVATADVGTNKAVTVTVSAGYLSGVDAVNYQLPVIAGSPTVNISRADQATLNFTSATTSVYGQTLTLTTTGGTGTGTTSYAVDSGPCSVSGSTLSSSAAGSCVITATKAQDANYLAQTATSTFEIAFANQAAVSITSATTVVYGSTLTLTASGGAGTGAFEFAKVSGPCSISGTTLSTTAVGNCIFQARKQADSGYNASAWTSNFTVTITPKPLSLAVTVDPSSRQYNTSRTVTLAPTSASNLTGIINNDVVSTDDSKLSAQVSTADVATNKVVTVTVAQGFLTGANAGNYQLPTVSGTPVITITRTAQAAITVTSALTTVFGQNISLSATGGSGTGALTFATTGGPCTVASSIMTPTSAGSCVVVATRAEDTNYLAQTQTETISIAAATQSTVTVTSATSVEYGSTLTLTASGGTGTGAYSFAKVSGACDVVGTTLIPLSAGECVIHARKAGDASYATSAWSADVTITLTPKPLTLFVTPSPGLRPYNGSSIVELATTTAADLVGIEPGDDVSVDHSKLVATVSSPSVGVNKAVTVTVNAGYVIGPDSGNYQLPTIVGTPLLTITQTNQAGISFANASSVQYGQNLNLVASGGSGSGALTIVRTSGPCTVTNNVMTSTGVGTCAVTATRAADATYLEESTTANITITRASQTLNFTSNVPEEALPGMTYTPVAVSSGGASVSLNITNGLATVCSMSNGVVTFLARGQCVITASQSGTTNYLPASSVSQTIVAGMLNQTITFPAISDRNFGSTAFSASATVNSGLSLGYNTTTGSICSVNSSGLITPLAVGNCSITVTQALGNDVYASASPVTRTFRVLAIVPTAPQITSVSSGDSSITVAFTPPASRGGAPITNYVLTATPTSGPSIIKSDCAAVPVQTPPACTISGLTNGESYTVAVAATNSAGTGPDSNTSPSIAPATAPDSVASLAAIPGNTTLTVTWRPPTNFGGGTFSRYEVTITPRGESPLPTVNLFASTANRHTFTGLTNGVAYDVEVVVISSANTTDMGSNRATAIGIPATEASAPRNVVITPTSSSTALVTWEVPTSNGGSPITGYSLSPGGCIFSTPTATRCEYRGLTPGSTLNVSVTAMNIMGGSPAAEASAVMPAAPVAVVSAARTVSPTVTPTPPVEAPPVISSIPEFRDAPYPGIQFDAPATGNAKALLDGNEIEAWLSVSEQTVTVQTEQGVLVTLQNTTQSTTNGSSLVLNPGSTVAVEAQGYTPNSPLEAWIFSTPARLGAGIADETGSFKGEFPLSSAAQLGQHTVVLHGLSTQGEVVTVAIGVKIVAPVSQTPEPESGSDSLLFSSVLMFLAVMVTLTVLVMRRRARKSGE